MKTYSSSETYWWLLDMASDLAGGNPLIHTDSDGLVFTINGSNYYQLYLPKAVFSRLDGSYGAFVGALSAEIVSRTELAGYSVTLDYTNSKTIVLADGSMSSVIPAIVLHAPVGVDVTSIGFHHYADAVGSYDVYGDLADGPTIISDVDIIVGTSGNDFLLDTPNNNLFDGGAGLDTAVFTGTRASHSFFGKDSLGQWKLSSSADGTDTLTNVERLHFSDKTLALDIDGSAGQAYRLYQAAFNRAPDTEGITFQTHTLDNGWSLSSIAKNFIDSPEFSNTYGRLDNAQFVTQLYQNVLHRVPDAGGLQYHVDHLNQGWARENVLVGFSESPENQVAVIGVIQGGIELIY